MGQDYIADSITIQYHAVPEIHLTSPEAVAMGFSFRKCGSHVRLNGYHGTAADLILPSSIDGIRVNRIRVRAFSHNQTIRRIQIPDSVTVLGSCAFLASSIEECIMGTGIRKIEQNTFSDCKQLHTVQLPQKLWKLSAYAFRYCKALRYIEIPRSCRVQEEGVFAFSGLEGFGTEGGVLNNAKAFTYTPLQKNHRIIYSQKDDANAHILMFGSLTDGIIIKDRGRVTIAEGALESTSAKRFDFMKCERVIFPEELFKVTSCIIPRKTPEIHLYLRRNSTNLFYAPSHVLVHHEDDVVYECTEIAYIRRFDELTAEDKASGYLPQYGIEGNVEELTLLKSGWHPLELSNYGFSCPNLRKLTLHHFIIPKSVNTIFSPWCGNLQTVQLISDYFPPVVLKHIPPSALIGWRLHIELLQAFRRIRGRKLGAFWVRRDDEMGYFFDSEVVAEIFRRRTYQYQQLERTISQRQKIFIALDALRSTHRDYDADTSIYREYLRTHKRYAEILCRKVQAKYPEYLAFWQSIQL